MRTYNYFCQQITIKHLNNVEITLHRFPPSLISIGHIFTHNIFRYNNNILENIIEHWFIYTDKLQVRLNHLNVNAILRYTENIILHVSHPCLRLCNRQSSCKKMTLSTALLARTVYHLGVAAGNVRLMNHKDWSYLYGYHY